MEILYLCFTEVQDYSMMPLHYKQKQEIQMYRYWSISLLFIALLISMPAFSKPASQENIRKLVELTGAGDMGVQMMNQMIPTLKQMIPDAPETFWTDVMSEVDGNQIIELVIPVYQKYLSEEDVNAINAFYNTPAGKNLIQVQPAIIRESMMLGQEWGEGIAQKVITKYQAQAEKQP